MSFQSQKKGQAPNTWQIQEAKAHFSMLINSLELNGLQRITKQGKEVAVVLSKKEYDKLVEPKTTLADFFANSPLGEFDVHIERSKDEMRHFDL